MKKHITIALAGNPNVGKSTVFNNLTGARQNVGNWPGKTVEKKEGTINYKNYQIKAVDLPGTYSLTTYSTEEKVACDFIIHDKPDVIVHVVDSTNLERNLYLTTQIIELGVKVILLLNMSYVAKKQNLKIDEKKISTLLKIPVLKISATKKEGMKSLLDTIVSLSSKKSHSESRIRHGEEIESHFDRYYLH